MKVSVILPTYNEAENIVELVRQIRQHIPQSWDYEIIVVDDNSPDQTYRLVESTFKDDPSVIPVLRIRDRGLAQSIRTGIERARGDQILVMDTDFTHDPAEIPKLLHVAQVYDIVSGSRFCAGGRMDSRRHYLASLAFNWLMRLVLHTQVQDNLGGYFTIQREKLALLPYDSIFFGYGDYFFRLLHYAQRETLSVVELPAIYRTRNKGASKSHFGKLLFDYTKAMVDLRVTSSKRPLV